MSSASPLLRRRDQPSKLVKEELLFRGIFDLCEENRDNFTRDVFIIALSLICRIEESIGKMRIPLARHILYEQARTTDWFQETDDSVISSLAWLVQIPAEKRFRFTQIKGVDQENPIGRAMVVCNAMMLGNVDLAFDEVFAVECMRYHLFGFWQMRSSFDEFKRDTDTCHDSDYYETSFDIWMPQLVAPLQEFVDYCADRCEEAFCFMRVGISDYLRLRARGKEGEMRDDNELAAMCIAVEMDVLGSGDTMKVRILLRYHLLVSASLVYPDYPGMLYRGGELTSQEDESEQKSNVEVEDIIKRTVRDVEEATAIVDQTKKNNKKKEKRARNKRNKKERRMALEIQKSIDECATLVRLNCTNEQERKFKHVHQRNILPKGCKCRKCRRYAQRHV